MINPLENLVKEVLANLPQSAQHLQQDIRQSLQSGLEIGLKKLDLVTRDEFEVQRAVLTGLQERVRQLESRLAEIEKTTAKG